MVLWSIQTAHQLATYWKQMSLFMRGCVSVPVLSTERATCSGIPTRPRTSRYLTSSISRYRLSFSPSNCPSNCLSNCPSYWKKEGTNIALTLLACVRRHLSGGLAQIEQCGRQDRHNMAELIIPWPPMEALQCTEDCKISRPSTIHQPNIRKYGQHANPIRCMIHCCFIIHRLRL